jgi:hypothetical protein
VSVSRDRRRLKSVRRVVAGVIAGAVLAGCAGLPTSGPVASGDVVVNTAGSVIPVADQPGLGDDPKRIVSGFINAAAAGFRDDFMVARSYLNGPVAQTWNPTTQVVVAARTMPMEVGDLTDENKIVVTVPVVARVDEAGRYTEMAPGARESYTYTLSRNQAGEWRISGLSDGILMLQPTFATVYRALPLYFPSPDLSHLVPDVRYFPDLNIATSATTALLGGPSPWLRDAVYNPVPDGMQLFVDAVPVDEAVAQVDVTRQFLGASVVDQQMFLAALTRTLTSVPTIRSVQVRVEGADIGGLMNLGLTVAASSEAELIMMVDGDVVLYRDRELVPWPDLTSLSGLDASAPVTNTSGTALYMLASGGTRLISVHHGYVTELHAGTSLVPPSTDRYGWIWTGERVSSGFVHVIDPLGSRTEVTVPWLAGRTVEAIKVSPGGARIAILSTGEGGPLAAVAGIVRDEFGVPVSVTDPLPVGADLVTATDVAWYDATAVAILGTTEASADPTVHLATVGGPTISWQTQPQAVGIAAADKVVYVVDAQGVLWRRDGTVWTEVAQGVQDPSIGG